MSAVFGGGAAPEIRPTPIPTPPQLPNITSAGYADMAQAARLQGMASTIATGGQGVTSPARTTKKNLTGQ